MSAHLEEMADLAYGQESESGLWCHTFPTFQQAPPDDSRPPRTLQTTSRSHHNPTSAPTPHWPQAVLNIQADFVPFSLPGKVRCQMSSHFSQVLLSKLSVLTTVARARLAEYQAFKVWILQPKHLPLHWLGCSSPPGVQGWGESSFFVGPRSVGSSGSAWGYQRGQMQELKKRGWNQS